MPSKGKSYEGLVGRYLALMNKQRATGHVNPTIDAALDLKKRPDFVVLFTGTSGPLFDGVPTGGTTF